MLPRSFTTLLSVLLPARNDRPSGNSRQNPVTLANSEHSSSGATILRFQDLNVDVFRMIALQLDKDDMQNVASCSRVLRGLSSPILFACCRARSWNDDDEEDPDLPPPIVRCFAQRLVHYNYIYEPRHAKHFARLLDCLPNLKSVTFDHAGEGCVPWRILELCFARPRITSLALGENADFLQTESFPPAKVAATAINLTEFSYVMPPWRALRHGQMRRPVNLGRGYVRENECLSAILMKMNETAVRLALPLETAPLDAMAAKSWPRLREVEFRGTYLDAANTLSLPPFLQSLPHIRKISILGFRRTGVPRAPTLGRRSFAPTPPNHTSSQTPITAFENLRSLTIADPDPDDDIFSVHMPCLAYLSLRDWHRLYQKLSYDEGDVLPRQRAVLTSEECLSILKRIDCPSLQSLELVYIAESSADDELLSYISNNFPILTHLEIHRYRADRKARVPYAHIAQYFVSMKSLRVIRLNLDFEDDHGAYCNNRKVRRQWYPQFKTRGWELLNILQDCPFLEYVGLLYHGDPTATWVEFHPPRCAEPRYVEEYNARTIDSEPSSTWWMHRDDLELTLAGAM